MHTSMATAGIKKAELLSSLGAGVLGGGLALLLAKLLAPYALPILVLGLLAHSVGMYRKHQLEQRGEAARLWWAEALYWFCWLALAAMLLWIVISRL